MNRFRRHRPLFSSPVPKARQKARMKWVILPVLWKAVKRLCTALGAMVLISMIWGGYLALSVMQSGAAHKALPREMVLYLNFDGAVQELPKEGGFADPFAVGTPTVRELVAAIDRARDDERVKGIYARIEGAQFAIAHVQELREAIKRFRKSGKFAYVYSTSYGEDGGGLGGYYLASAFEQVWMQPIGVVMVNGLNAEAPYFREVLDKIGVEPHFFQRKDYKTALENVTRKDMSPQSREMVSNLLDDISEALIQDIPPERGISEKQFRALVDQGLFTGEQALKNRLITNLDYADVLVGNMKEAVTGDREAENEDVFATAGQYLESIKEKAHDNPFENTPLAKTEMAMKNAKPKVALIYAVGVISPSKTGANAPAFVDGGVAAADEIASAIIAAGEDEEVQAIVLRIDSPGGSPVASETILRAVGRAQEKGKPVIVSMGPTAASGGYWIASKADRIFAMPTTITGSIGVVGGKFTASALSEKIGVKWDGVKWGKNSGMWSMVTPYSESEAERFNLMLDDVYNAFLQRVAKGRRMTAKQVDEIAGGRVWSGKRAITVGLVDELGGLTETLNYTAQQLGKESKKDLAILIYPKPKSPIEQFLDLLESPSEIYEGMRWQVKFAQMLAPVLQQISIAQNPENYSVYEPLSIQ